MKGFTSPEKVRKATSHFEVGKVRENHGRNATTLFVRFRSRFCY